MMKKKREKLWIVNLRKKKRSSDVIEKNTTMNQLKIVGKQKIKSVIEEKLGLSEKGIKIWNNLPLDMKFTK